MILLSLVSLSPGLERERGTLVISVPVHDGLHGTWQRGWCRVPSTCEIINSRHFQHADRLQGTRKARASEFTI
jgi:hypothetical protein